MRADGTPPKAIARALGVRPAVIAPLVRRLAAESPTPPAADAELAGCWISPNWSRELLVQRRHGWEDIDLRHDGPAGIALVLVARAARHDRVSVCGYLVDTFCLGVKNAIGPEDMHRRDVLGFARMYSRGSPPRPCGHRSSWHDIWCTAPSRSRQLSGSTRIRTSRRFAATSATWAAPVRSRSAGAGGRCTWRDPTTIPSA